MQFSKYNKILLALTFFTSSAFAAFSDTDCLESSFDTSVTHKAFPFGLTETTLAIKKNSCVIEITHNKLKMVDRKWIIDVCRGPIHIKYGTGSIDVFKRIDNCRNNNTPSEYCQHLSDLEVLLQDDGLIFADGDKDNLEETHGKVYCSYMLALAYLEKGMVFNRSQQYSDILSRGIYKAEIVKPEGQPLLSLPHARQTIDTKVTTPQAVQASQNTMNTPEKGATGEF